MIDDNKPRLGRGLAALLGDVGTDTEAVERGRGQRKIPVAFIRANPKNPRKAFDETSLEELADSIREKGVIQPILVRAVQGISDQYELIAGERRWRASQRAGIHDIPAVVVEASDRDALEMAIIENVQRSDLNALEEAQGYEQLAAEFGYSQSELAKIIGKSRSHIANTLRLLKLPEYSRSLLVNGALSAGHGRALLAYSDPDSVAKRALEEQLTVRDLERQAQPRGEEAVKKPDKKAKGAIEKDPDTRALEQTLTDALGLIVGINHAGEKGEVIIRYTTLDQLDALCRRLSN